MLIRIAKGREEDSNSDGDDEGHGNDESDGNRTSDGGGGHGGGDRQQREARVQHVQIDTGKTWREGVIRWFPRYGGDVLLSWWFASGCGSIQDFNLACVHCSCPF